MPVAEHTPIEDRVVFVGGVHRSGTTPLARWVATHPDVSGLSGTNSPEDEGQHLQSVYPAAGAHGGQGRFALDPAARLTEDSPLVTADAARRLLDAWLPFWDDSKAVLVEKSPPNLIRMRFLRALFPSAKFIVVVRHPIAVSLATRRVRRASMDSLIRHWLAAYHNVVDDARHVGNVALIRYEDLMASPATELDRIFAFLSLPPHSADWPVRGGLNDAYFSRFGSLLRPWNRARRTRLARRYEAAVQSFGYSLVDPGRLTWPDAPLAELRPSTRELGRTP